MEASWVEGFFQQLCQDEKQDVLAAITPHSIKDLFKVLSNCLSASTHVDSISLTDISLQCIVKIVHTLHLSSFANNQGSLVDLPSVLDEYFQLLDIQLDKPDLETIVFKTHLLDVVCQILDCQDRPTLQAICLGLSCFQRILSILKHFEKAEKKDEDVDMWNKLLYSSMRALQALADSSSPAKEIFEAVNGYECVKGCLMHWKTPSKDVLFCLFKWMVGIDFKDGKMDIEDEQIMLILINWLPVLPPHLQRFLSDLLMQAAMFSSHNLTICANIGVTTSILNLFKKQPTHLDPESREMLLMILEAIGSASMKPNDFHEFMMLLRPQKNDRQDFEFERLLEALIKISTYNEEITKPFWYFDLRHKSSGISVPPIEKWGGPGFTFHAWVSFKSSKSEDLPDTRRASEDTNDSSSFSWVYRRQLYSFLTSSGTGLEAFLTSEGHLIIAVSNKKDYVTAPLVNVVLDDNQWHSLLIIHTPSRRPLARKDNLTVYVDGLLKMTVPIKLPSMSEPFTSCHIGCGGPQTISSMHDQVNSSRGGQISTQLSSFIKGHFRDTHVKPFIPDTISKFRTHIPIGQQDDYWGVPESMQGQLGPVCVFNVAIPEQFGSVLFNVGPNCVSLFQPQGISEEDQSPTLANKLVLYYNAKVSINHRCVDLSPPHSNHVPVDGRLTGELCFNSDIKNVINSVGGMEVFLPLLEQVEYRGHDGNEKNRKNRENEENGESKVDGEDEIKRKNKVNEENKPESVEEKTAASDLKNDVGVLSTTSSVDQWVFIDEEDKQKRKKPLSFKESNGVTIILRLLENILKGSTRIRDSFLRSHEVATLGVVLEKIDGRLIDVQVLLAVQKLVETVKRSNEVLMPCIFQYILFNFALWSRCEFAIRIAHLQYLSTIIKDDPDYFRCHFGTEFILDVVRTYYVEESLTGQNGNILTSSNIDQSSAKIIRGSLFGIINFFLKQKVEPHDVANIIQYIAKIRDENGLKEILELVNGLCRGPTKVEFITGISYKKHLSVLFMLVANLTNPSICCAVIRVLSCCLSETSLPQTAKDNLVICSEIFPGFVAHIRQKDSDGFTEISMLELGLNNHDELRDLRVYDDFKIILPIVGLLNNKSTSVKLHVAQTLLKSVKESILSAIKCAREVAWYDPVWRLLLKTKNGVEENGAEGAEGNDLVQDLLETVVQVVFHVLWFGIEGYNDEAWKARGEVIACISTINSLEDFLVPYRELERRLLELCLAEILQDIQKSGQTGVKETTSALQVTKLLDDFIFTSGSIAGTVENESQTTWSTKLVETMVRLLGSLNVWDNFDSNAGWEDMAEIGDKILLEFLLQDNTEYCAYASSMIFTVWQNRTVDSQEKVCYLLGKVYQAFKMSKSKDGDSKFTFTLPLLRHILKKYGDFVPLTTYVPDFPTSALDSDYEEQFLQCVDSDEFGALIKQQIVPSMRKYETYLSKSSIDSGRFWMDCLNGLTTSLQEREEMEEASKKTFESFISTFDEIVAEANSAYQTRHLEKHAQINRVLRQWELTKRDLQSEIGIWRYNKAPATYWKLSTTENFSRMRLKLTPNYYFNPHHEASRLRDTGEVSEPSHMAKVLSGAVADQLLVKHYAEDRLEITGNVEFGNTSSMLRDSSNTDKDIPKSFDCKLITLMETVSGTLTISTNSLSFNASVEENTEGSSWDFKIALNELREIHLRSFNHRRSALEFFLLDQTNYFINFTKESRNLVYTAIMSFKPSNLYYGGVRSPAELLQASGLVKKWVRREISNFDYLIQLNTIAGRTYNDLSQYPIFPWILCDYTSEELDLTDPKVFRDLSKPIGALNQERAAEVKQRYDQFIDPSGCIPKFHYGVHYSTAAGVLHYMIRVEPFTSLHIKLQSGRFDVSDRQFHSFQSTWESIYNHGNDVKELIPEFFYLPEFLENLNNFDLGVSHTGQRLHDVVLPAWAATPEDFIHKHRQALECDYVSENLHHWIDLIFGYKQRGEPAEQALNVFYYCTYEGAVDLDAITDETERGYTEEMINNFGQTPTQLLTEPHPKRMNCDEARELQIRHNAVPGSLVQNAFTDGGQLKAHAVKLANDGDQVVFASAGKSQSYSFINQGIHETLLTISSQGVVGVHQWLPYSRSKSKPFTCNVDATVTQQNHQRCIAAPFATDIIVGSQIFATTQDAKLIISGGHWDFSIRVFTTKAKLLQRLTYHNDTVTCLALDGDGHYFISGSRDLTCMVWLINHDSGMAQDVSGKPVQMLYGHERDVKGVAMSWELDLAVSVDEGNRCIVHTVRKGHFVRVLDIIKQLGNPTSDLLHFSHIALSMVGDIILACSNSSGTSQILKYSVNGKFLRKLNMKDKVTALTVRDNYVLVGTSSGALSIKTLHSLENKKTLNVRVRVCSINLTNDETHILVGVEGGQLLVFSVDATD